MQEFLHIFVFEITEETVWGYIAKNYWANDVVYE